MNRYCYLAIALCLFALAACSKKECLVPNHSQSSFVISFTDSKAETKAYSENTVTQVRQNGFGVACITDNDVVVFNEKAVWNPVASVYSTLSGAYYFPSTGTVSFYAVYPFSQAVTVSSGAASLLYTQDSSSDLLAAKRTGVPGGSSPVLFEFDHILSLVHFKAEGTDGSVVYRLKSISIDVPSSGTFDYDSYSWNASSATMIESCYSGNVLLSGVTDISSAVSFVPCSPRINVTWETYDLDGRTLISEYSDSKSLGDALSAGEECTITLKLPNRDAQEMFLDVVVKQWTTTENIADLV